MYLVHGFLFGLGLLLAYGLAVRGTKLFSRDDTDAAGKGPRSGMLVLTDHGTSVQYLCVYGALTPRLNPDGSLRRSTDRPLQ